MKNYEQYKRLIKCFSSSVIVLLEVGIYWIIWIEYYNQIIESPFWRRGNWLMVCLYGILLLFFLKMYGGFKIGYLKKGNIIYSQILSIILVNIITYLQIALLAKEFHPIVPMILMTLVDTLLVIMWTVIFHAFYSRLFPRRRMLLVYGDIPAFHLQEKINSREDKYQICGAVHINEGVDTIMGMAGQYDAVIIGDIPSHERNLLMKECFSHCIRIYTVPKISDILLRTSDELNIFDSPLYLSRNGGLKIEQRFAKRVLDILFSVLGLIITAPFSALIAISIKCSDRGPVIYKQTRLTKDGRLFEIYKFRTMVQDAEQDGIAKLASENDNRILPIGRMLRLTRLDELPQLINILKGEMSVVGPRPERPELAAEIERAIPEFSYRLRVKAGLTGYAQVYGKYNTTAYDKLKLDFTYIRNYSIWLDLKLIFMTPKIMLLKESTEGVKDVKNTNSDSNSENVELGDDGESSRSINTIQTAPNDPDSTGSISAVKETAAGKEMKRLGNY